MKNKNSKKYIKKQQKKKQLKRQKAMSKRADVLAERKEKKEQFQVEDNQRRMRQLMQPTTYRKSQTILQQLSIAEQVFGPESEDNEEESKSDG